MIRQTAQLAGNSMADMTSTDDEVIATPATTELDCLLDDTTEDDAAAIEEVTDLFGFLDELQEEEDKQNLPQPPSQRITIPKISVPIITVPTITVPAITVPTNTMPMAPTLNPPQANTSTQLPQTTRPSTAPTAPRPEVLPSYSLHLTRRQRVQRWHAKRARRTWNKAHNAYYAIRKKTASKRRRVGGKFSGSSVSWVAA